MQSKSRHDGVWILFWPLAMAVGIWGIGLMSDAFMKGWPTFWPGLALLVGGGFLSGRWIAQARQWYRTARRVRSGSDHV